MPRIDNDVWKQVPDNEPEKGRKPMIKTVLFGAMLYANPAVPPTFDTIWQWRVANYEYSLLVFPSSEPFLQEEFSDQVQAVRQHRRRHYHRRHYRRHYIIKEQQ
jgi:hypothetical protein